MLTYLLLFFLPGVILCGAAGLAWRRLKQNRPHWLVALALAVVVWIGGWWMGLWLFLDVINGGVAGDVAGGGLIWSATAAVVGYQVFRRYGGRSPHNAQSSS